ncbi:armadillo-type protein [Cladochytrium replicatum]|nr:armadillo-type protein [Cladochytrium replicatum]
MSLVLPPIGSPTKSKPDFKKINDVLNGRYTKNMYDRHEAILEKLTKAYAEGLYISDLRDVSNVMQIALEKIGDGAKSLVAPLAKLLDVCRPPYLIDASSTQTSKECASHLTELLAVIAEASRLESVPIVEVVTSIMLVIYSGQILIAPTRKVTSSSILQDVLSNREKTLDVVDKVGRSLQTNTDPKAQHAVLRLIRLWSYKHLIRDSLAQEYFICPLLDILINPDDRPGAPLVTEVLWNILESEQRESAARILGTTWNKDSVNRFVEIGLADVIAVALVGTELRSVGNSMNLPLLTSCGDDFDFKRLVLHLAATSTEHSENLKVFLDHGLLQFIVAYLDCNIRLANRVWSDGQLHVIQLEFVRLLTKLMPTVCNEFVTIGGAEPLLELLQVSINDLLQQTGIRRSDHVYRGDLVVPLLRCLLSLGQSCPAHRVALGNNRALDVVFPLIITSSMPTNVWTSAFLLLSTLGRGCKENKRIFGQLNGIKFAIPFLRYDSADPIEKEAVQLAAVECIWTMVCRCPPNEGLFFDQEGIFFMLDLVESSSKIVQKHCLGCLLDLLENPKARLHMLEWRGSVRNRNTATLLIELWNAEEVELGALPGGPGGVLLNEASPLKGTSQKYVTDAAAGSIAELSSNIRAKIYCIFCKLGFETVAERLSADECVKLTLISKYLDFKIGEVWEEISQELEREGIRPVPPDFYCLTTAKSVTKDKSQAVRNKQEELIREKIEHEHELLQREFRLITERNNATRP